MKIAVLGGGITGLTAAYYLAKKNYQVTVFEKEKNLGGLASGFKIPSWNWYLERTIHHVFANDKDILNLAKEVGFNKIFFREPETSSLYEIDKKQFPYLPVGRQVFPLDNPQDFLKFPLLSFPQKIRAGLILTFLKLSPFLSFYEQNTAEKFLRRSMGDEVWNILWQQLFRKKFGKYAENILASFIWARIKKRTKKLGYVEGGFQNFINYLEKKIIEKGGRIIKEYQIDKIKKINGKFQLNEKDWFDGVVSTLPTPILIKASEGLFPSWYLSQLKKINYLHAISLVLETNRPILNKTYWLNISAPEIPIMGIFQQTNFINKKNYGGKDISYLGWYVDFQDRLWKMTDKEILDFVFPYLEQITGHQPSITNYFVFRAPWAQPIFDRNFLKNKPRFKTPIKNFYLANLEMTYPFDRGTNYAVKLGKEVSGFF